jgi:hypothetical protein
MKKVIALLVLSFLALNAAKAQPGLNIAQQHKAYIDSLLATVGIGQQTIASGILYDRAINIANLQRFKQTDVINKGKFMQSALELQNSAYDTPTQQTVDMLKGISDYYTYLKNQAPIGINFNKITHIDTLAVEKGYIIIDEQGRPRPTGRLKTHGLIDREIFMAAALSDKKQLDAITDFVIPSELFMGNKRASITQIEVDFDDGLGFRIVLPDEAVNVVYQTAGKKAITIKATTDEEKTLSSTALIEIKDDDPFEWGEYGKIDEELQQVPIYANIPFNGSNGNFPGLGWVTFLLHDPEQGLQKPVLVVDGFDPGNQYYDERLFEEYLNTHAFPFADSLYAAGYDLVILDFRRLRMRTLVK